jgi:copper oxidase (laccase) domain-containing protein
MLAIDQTHTRADYIAALGPCIGQGAFEVGQDVLDAFHGAFGNSAPIRRTAGGKGKVDLSAAARLQLKAAGLSEASVEWTDRCTVTHPNEFFSHRRDNGITGRMAAVILPTGS